MLGDSVSSARSASVCPLLLPPDCRDPTSSGAHVTDLVGQLVYEDPVPEAVSPMSAHVLP